MVRIGEACEDCIRNCVELHQKQKDSSPIVTRFFKPMLEDHNCHEVLFLPPCFARMVQHLANQETEIEDCNGGRWPVTYSYVDGYLAFQKGWPKFFQDHDLKVGELLFFNYIKGGHFVVHILGTTAVERNNFVNARAPQKKRPRREVPSIDVTSMDKPSSDDSFVSGSERHKNCHSHVRVANSDIRSGQRVSTCIDFEEEDLTCMVNRDDGLNRGEDRNYLYDLSSMEIDTRGANKFDNVSDRTIAPSEDVLNVKIALSNGKKIVDPADNFRNVLNTKRALSNGGITRHGDKIEKLLLVPEKEASHADNTKRADKFKKTLVPNVAPSQSEAIEHVDKFWKAYETNILPSRTETTNKTRTNGDGVVFADVARTKPSDKSSMSKDTSDDVHEFQNGNHVQLSDSESLSLGSSKIVKRNYALKNRLRGSSVSGSVPKNPSGKPNIKKERVESVENANGRSKVSFGKKPTFVRKGGQISPPVVKVEPDLLDDTVVSIATYSVTAEVESLSYMELPKPIPPIPGRKDRGRGKVVYLKDREGRIWPVLNPNILHGKPLTANWGIFCEKNNIKVGDECKFQVEDPHLGIYKVML